MDQVRNRRDEVRNAESRAQQSAHVGKLGSASDSDERR